MCRFPVIHDNKLFGARKHADSSRNSPRRSVDSGIAANTVSGNEAKRIRRQNPPRCLSGYRLLNWPCDRAMGDEFLLAELRLALKFAPCANPLEEAAGTGVSNGASSAAGSRPAVSKAACSLALFALTGRCWMTRLTGSSSRWRTTANGVRKTCPNSWATTAFAAPRASVPDEENGANGVHPTPGATGEQSLS